MREFLKEVFVHKSNFKAIKISHSDKRKIQETALSLLNLKDLNQLRDRFEGALFYKRFTRELMAEIALEKYLSCEFIDWDAKGKIKDYPNEIKVKNIEIKITPFDFGEYPILIDENPQKPEIFCIKKAEDTIYICGIATKKILLENQKKLNGIPMVLGKKVGFIGFDKLQRFENIEELYKIVE
ncbi:MAG: hypothetical protein MUF43_07290 [Flavobacterium sp.]|jgi:hypothetical protein|nr:hypothetical protein [Flavobacterium sp.]